LSALRRRALGLGVAALLLGCGPKPRPALPEAPAVRAASDLMPPDLDVVVRLDFGRVRQALGAIALTALSREVLSRGNAGQEPDVLLVASLLDAETVFLGYRPGAWLEPLDRVLALQGHFTQLATPPAGFTGATDLGADFRYWDRKPSQEPLSRGAVARVYAQGERLRAFVSEAELDAVERTLTGQGAERRLAPPEEGTLSVAARPWLLHRLLTGGLRELLIGAKQLTGVVDLESDGVSLKLELLLASASDAERLAAAGKEVLARLAEPAIASATELRADAERVVLVAKLSRAQLAPLVSCLQPSSHAKCPW
jgi:hypothetical protein